MDYLAYKTFKESLELEQLTPKEYQDRIKEWVDEYNV